MLILAFDTSSKTVSVAILQDDIVLYETVINVGLNHSEVLLPAIDQACIQTRIKIAEIDLFACTIGPGSFTGLRIGASTMKGFVLAAKKPAVGVSSLAAVALNADKCSKIIHSIMDAGRGQVYSAFFKYKENGLLEQIGKEKVMKPSEIKYNNDVVFVGDGAVRYADIISDKKNNIILASRQYCRASSVGLLGKEKFDRKELLDTDKFVPLYIRSVDADTNKTLFKNQ
jgi:tRNA threonylcarbamoyladenosine biosynthesis protein TsaB